LNSAEVIRDLKGFIEIEAIIIRPLTR